MLSKDLIDASVRDMMSFKAFQNWINKSRRGEKLSYYRGYIVDPTIQRIAPTNDRVRVDKFRRQVMNACDDNLVTLVQKKHGNLDYEYIAIRKNALTPKEVEKVRIGTLAKVINGVSK
ncbi:MAG: hypothetical protein V1244_05755 [Nitrospinaceae bacterium]|jgi:hypothetical protein|nr:hypothetical protein [Nitrospinaceae bacterium]